MAQYWQQLSRWLIVLQIYWLCTICAALSLTRDHLSVSIGQTPNNQQVYSTETAEVEGHAASQPETRKHDDYHDTTITLDGSTLNTNQSKTQLYKKKSASNNNVHKRRHRRSGSDISPLLYGYKVSADRTRVEEDEEGWSLQQWVSWLSGNSQSRNGLDEITGQNLLGLPNSNM